jgi:hypothetical protein
MLLTLGVIVVRGGYASIRFLWRRRRVVVIALCADRLPAASVVLGEPLPAASLGLVKLGKHMKPTSQEMDQDKYDAS